MSFSCCSEYLVSIAGYCDNSVCVWDLTTGEMISGVKDISVLNDVSCRKYHNKKCDYVLEFVTGGR